MSDNPLAEAAPLFHILGKDVTQMSDAELAQHLNELRALKGSAPTRKSRMNKKAEPKSKVNFDELFKLK